MSQPVDSAATGGIPPALYSQRPDRGLAILTTILPAAVRVGRRLMRDRPHPVAPVPVVLTVVDRQVHNEDADVVSLLLAGPGLCDLPPWHPGAHIDVVLPSGRMRQYSLNGDPADRAHYRIAVRRLPAGGGGSMEVHDALRLGDRVEVLGPRNAFPLSLPGHGSTSSRIRFVAGGIGITPILAMVAFAERYGVDWSLVYSGRTRASLAFTDELARYGDRVRIRTDDVDGLPTAADLLGVPDAGTSVYACGPAPLLDLVSDSVAGIPGAELHIERFTSAPVAGGREFEVELARSGTMIAVPADVSLLDAIRPGRPQIAYSCRQGFCGTCVVRVLDGEADHRDALLSDERRDAGEMLICVSRAAGDRLVIDA